MTSLACEWGLSLHLESRRAGSKAQFMLDFGYTPEIVLRNADLLDIDLAKIDGRLCDAAPLAHAGRPMLLQWRRRRLPREISRRSEGPNLVGLGAATSHTISRMRSQPGYIERNSFEQVSGGSMVYEYDHFTETERRGKLLG